MADRFWSKVFKTDSCWNWIAGKNPAGYGRYGYKRKTPLAHRHSWMLSNGPIPIGMLVLHRCDNPSCVRPDHLFIGTHADNSQDKINKGRDRHVRGEQGGRTKLTKEQILQIRTEPGTHAGLGRKYGVSAIHILKIKTHRTWTHLNNTQTQQKEQHA